jgi:hypothetical protein
MLANKQLQSVQVDETQVVLGQPASVPVSTSEHRGV